MGGRERCVAVSPFRRTRLAGGSVRRSVPVRREERATPATKCKAAGLAAAAGPCSVRRAPTGGGPAAFPCASMSPLLLAHPGKTSEASEGIGRGSLQSLHGAGRRQPGSRSQCACRWRSCGWLPNTEFLHCTGSVRSKGPPKAACRPACGRCGPRTPHPMVQAAHRLGEGESSNKPELRRT